MDKKLEVQRLLKEANSKIKFTQEIKLSYDNKLWECIKKLRQNFNSTKNRETAQLYDTMRQKLERK